MSHVLRLHAHIVATRLLESEPRVLALDRGEALDSGCARVGRQWRAARRVGVGEHEDIVAAAERILVDRARLDDHLGVVAGRLVSR
eukprot:6211947-Pleurochrysis_carterae.AAC.5